MDFTAAKSAADADEASLDAATSAAALEQQRAFLDARVAACANIRTTAQLEDFVVVAELDASGRVTNTWRRGDSPLALCIERRSEEHTSELQSLMRISYAVFCLKKKTKR